MSGIVGLLAREWRLARRQAAGAAIAVLFFLAVPLLVALGLGPEPQLLARIAPGMIWIAALLSVLLSLDRLFAEDYDDGSLDLLLSGPAGPLALATAKIAAHWLIACVPLLIAAPALALMMNLPAEALPVLLLALLLGTPSLSLIGAAVAALLLAARRGGVLLALLVLPLYLPVLIFGAAAVDAAAQGLSPRPHLLLLAAILAVALPLAPLAAGAALKEAAR